ncbi:hypothetical protein [Rossellomorea sp. YZS02]|nr:hypothetical protein [Rossellomorea sp. YZS02]MDX8344165.1 hypothetical protein [Rossellomorea sp. YZS02]
MRNPALDLQSLTIKEAKSGPPTGGSSSSSSSSSGFVNSSLSILCG